MKEIDYHIDVQAVHRSTRYESRQSKAEIETHPLFATHYIQPVEMMDTGTGIVVARLEGFSDESVLEALDKARKNVHAWLLEQPK